MNSTNASATDARGDLLLPDWDRPAAVRAVVTLRHGGVSRGRFGLAGGMAGGWNLAAHCGDSALDVAVNRARLRAMLPSEPLWLEQVHGNAVFDADPGVAPDAPPPVADACVTTVRGRVLAVLTADCLPVLVANSRGSAVGIVHAGWRGLAAGVIERTVARLACVGGDPCIVAWLGPAIGPGRFEVGDEVRHIFVDADADARQGFIALPERGKWLADLYLLARLRLARCGVGAVSGGGLCTSSDDGRFYSFRRDRETGRMASLIWLA